MLSPLKPATFFSARLVPYLNSVFLFGSRLSYTQYVLNISLLNERLDDKKLATIWSHLLFWFKMWYEEELICTVHLITAPYFLLSIHSACFGYKLCTREQILVKKKVISPILPWSSLSVYMWNFVFLNKLYKYSFIRDDILYLLPSVTKEPCFWFLKRCPVLLYNPMVTGLSELVGCIE